MTSTQAPVRLATRADLPRVVRTLGCAFAGYPFFRHMITADDHHQRVERFQELFVSHIGLDHGRVWVAGDGDAVAVWTTPATAQTGDVFAVLAPTFAELAGDRVREQEHAEAAMRVHRPSEPVWFLGSAGVHPQLQGRGLGSAVIRPGITAAAHDGVPAFLETQHERNVAFYQRLGFEVTADFHLPDGGPRTWSMLARPPG